jgi:cytochrome P450
VSKEQTRHKAKVDAGAQMNSKSFSFLEALVHASLEESTNALSTDELIDNVGAINFGAFDTTSNTTALLLVSLARNPIVQERLYDHVKHINLHSITLEDLQTYDYLINTINEQNRFLAIAPMIPRSAIEDVVLDNNKLIKKGTGVFLHSYAMGRDPSLWDGAQDLDEFKPERWSTFTPSKVAYIPFGFGGRMCPGKAIAMNNLATIVTFFVQRFRVEETDIPVKLANHVGLGVRTSDKLRFIPR